MYIWCGGTDEAGVHTWGIVKKNEAWHEGNMEEEWLVGMPGDSCPEILWSHSEGGSSIFRLVTQIFLFFEIATYKKRVGC